MLLSFIFNIVVCIGINKIKYQIYKNKNNNISNLTNCINITETIKITKTLWKSQKPKLFTSINIINEKTHNIGFTNEKTHTEFTNEKTHTEITNEKTHTEFTKTSNIDIITSTVRPNVETSNPSSYTTSIATFYFRVGNDVEGCPSVQNFDDGVRYGPCTGDDGLSGVKYTSESKYWAAITNAKSKCGEYITVNYNGNSLKLRVMDECPACAADNHVDMSLDALIELTGSKENACAIGKTLPIITWY